MTPSKDTLEAANPTVETAVSQGNSRPTQDSSRMRSDAVSLEVPVKVHGSRVTDVVLGTTPHTEPFEEKTTTMIVFPQGGVLKMSTPVAAGQMMVATNLKSGHDSICRVIKVRAFAQGQSYVEIEFTHRQPGYWGVYFPSDGAEAANPVAPAPPVAPPVSVEVKVEKAPEKPSGDVSWAPASALKPPASALRPPAAKPASQLGKPESLFAQIGSQEDVQPAASATTRVRTNSARDTDSKGQVSEAVRKSLLADLPPAAAPSPAASLSMAELQGDSQAAPSVPFAGAGVPGEVADAPPAERSRAAAGESAAPFGKFAASAGLGGGQAAREPFGSGLSGGTLGIDGHAAESGQSKGRNWFAIAASVAVLLAAGAGAAYYMHLPPFAAKSAKSAAPMSAPAAPPVEASTQPGTAAPTASRAPSPMAQTNLVTAPVAANTPAVAARTEPDPAKPSKPASPLAVAASAPANQKPAAKVPDIFGSLNAHPTSRAHSTDAGQADAAPALDGVAGSENGELPAIASSAALPPPQAESQGPVRIRVGGALKPPQLVSSVLPVYPAMAREVGVEGDVVIDTTIDASGNVTGMKVISGPPILRQAALDALRHWKYAPSMLNGDAVPVQMTVTIKFHHQ